MERISVYNVCRLCAEEFQDEQPETKLSEDDLDEWFSHMSDVEADADTFRSCGWGTDEDYGSYDDGMYI